MRRALSSATHRVGVGLHLRFRSTLASAADANTHANANATAKNAKPTAHTPPLRDPKQRAAAPAHRGRFRVLDGRVVALLGSQTTPSTVVSLCEQLRNADRKALLAGTDEKAWRVALQKRLRQDDVDGARALLDLLRDIMPQRASTKFWNDLLFTVLRERTVLSSEREVTVILSALCDACGNDRVARVVASLVNGCANADMFGEARFLVRFHCSLASDVAMPPRVLCHLVSTMQATPRAQGLFNFTDELLAAIPLAAIHPTVWIALFRSQQTQADFTRRAFRVIDWFHAVQDAPVQDDRPLHLERVLGAVVQSCIASSNERLALRVFHAMTHEDEECDDDAHDHDDHETAALLRRRRVRPDENIYVNVLKACRVLLDDSLFRDVYRRMARDGAARSAGFGSAIRFCHERGDVAFLEQVLADAFAVEEAQFAAGKRKPGRRWFLELPQYNDALGCFAETKTFDRAKDLFARLLAHPSPRMKPDHYTMVEMVENYREAPFSELMDLMELFLELQVKPNMYVFTSLLAACGRHRLMNDALALREAMVGQQVPLDVKTFTALGYVYGIHGHVAGVVELLQDMASQGIETDARFFDVVFNGLYSAEGIDLCFALFRETLRKGLPIPATMYAALIAKGTKLGLVERTLHIAYNMECDGFPMTSEQLLALMRRCEASSEVAELVQTFLMLHQGRSQPRRAPPSSDDVTNDADDDADELAAPRFSQDVYEEMVALLTAFKRRDALTKVRQLAETAGYALP